MHQCHVQHGCVRALSSMQQDRREGKHDVAAVVRSQSMTWPQTFTQVWWVGFKQLHGGGQISWTSAIENCRQMEHSLNLICHCRGIQHNLSKLTATLSLAGVKHSMYRTLMWLQLQALIWIKWEWCYCPLLQNMKFTPWSSLDGNSCFKNPHLLAGFQLKIYHLHSLYPYSSFKHSNW